MAYVIRIYTFGFCVILIGVYFSKITGEVLGIGIEFQDL
jgi:hypothetical protein